jgi:hypothetical protein
MRHDLLWVLSAEDRVDRDARRARAFGLSVQTAEAGALDDRISLPRSPSSVELR